MTQSVGGWGGEAENTFVSLIFIISKLVGEGGGEGLQSPSSFAGPACSRQMGLEMIFN